MLTLTSRTFFKSIETKAEVQMECSNTGAYARSINAVPRSEANYVPMYTRSCQNTESGQNILVSNVERNVPSYASSSPHAFYPAGISHSSTYPATLQETNMAAANAYYPISYGQQAYYTQPQGEELTLKKKTRRGGKRARARREKDREQQPGTEEAANSQEKEKMALEKYKTEMCKNYVETGKCSYSVRCMFAHGQHELVQKDVSALPGVPYKKVLCEKFHQENCCNYGTKCIYIHEERNLDTIASNYYQNGLMLLNSVSDLEKTSKRRLSIFASLSEDSVEISASLTATQLQGLCNPKIMAPNDDCLSLASDSTSIAESSDDQVESPDVSVLSQ